MEYQISMLSIKSNFIQGLTTALAVSSTLLIRIWFVTWHWSYARLGLDVALLAIWIATLVAGIIRMHATSADPIDIAKKAKPVTIITLLVLVILEM